MKAWKRMLSCILLVCLAVALLLPKASAARTDAGDLTGVLNSLFSGVHAWYYREAEEPENWTEDQLILAMYGKLHNEVMGMDTWLGDQGLLKYYVEDDGIHFNLEFADLLCRSAFGLPLPRNVDHPVLAVEGNDLVISPTAGEHEQLYVNNYTQQGDTLWVTGCSVYGNPMGQQLNGYFLAELEENPRSVYGYTIRSIRAMEQNQTMTRWQVTASSELEQDYGAHYAFYMLDGDRGTAWCEGVDGVGRGEQIHLTTAAGDVREVSGIEICNGYLKNSDIQQKNGYVTRILVETEGGFSREYRVEWNELDYSNILLFDRSVFTSWVRITILEAEAGSKYRDTCISEIRLLGLDSSRVFPEPSEPPVTQEPTEPSQTPEQTVPAREETTPVEPEPTAPAQTQPSTPEKAPAAEEGPSVLLIVASLAAVILLLTAMIAYGRKK